MEITMSGFDATDVTTVGALPQSAQVSPITVRERCIAPTYAPMTGGVRLLPAMADLTDHPFVQGNVKGVRVRAWSPPD